ncbi:cobaltochelatase subunit CobN [Rhodoplanes sp. Z2-YC6860]|uniref:cobaltochelatase subunit CobN n=1 Tax=Rhodoplanes sp. Z2-YC6860 TaxID=674703 RepID=UPI00078CBC88|nr:cobaltochelatase subunit CobN [Rhodoplanes sp. Z2-YC6860]AMN43911.1 cobaltochelatase subunit CobN [Rhodoplanes sp. Z2-YC6860]
MHLLSTSSTSLDDIVEPVDLGQTPGDIAILSFADSDLAGLASAWNAERDALPSVRLVQLRDLKHPMSVDLWIDRVGTHAKVIVVRLLGGLDWWRYGADRLSALAKERGIALAMLPGEDRDDPRLAECSTLPADGLTALLAYFREGGRDNLRALLRRLAQLDCAGPRPLPRCGGYAPAAIDLERLVATLPNSRPVIPLVFYRSMLLAADVAPIDALAAALAARGLAPAPLFVPSLKDAESATFLRDAMRRLKPSVIVTTTAFAATGEGAAESPLDEMGVPVLQAVVATTRRAAWLDSPRGLGAADLAMHVVLPELDGRVLAGAIAFKNQSAPLEGLSFAATANQPEPDRVAMVADRVAALVKLRTTPREERRIAVLMPDYPGASGRTGYAVGLDVPASVLALLDDLAQAGYPVGDIPGSSKELLDELGQAEVSMPLDAYRDELVRCPADVVERIHTAWGSPETDPDVQNNAFHFRAQSFGNVTVALPPDRGRPADRRSDYHDPSLPPRHALMAFGLWLRHQLKADAIVHMGAHGTLEWLPGKAVALTASCFPEAVVGPLPVVYPFIVSNPGEAAQAKRRLAALTLGHMPPPLVGADLSGDARELERLVDEYAQADGLDRRRRERLARLIAETAQRSGLAREAGVGAQASPDEALRQIDAWLCDLKDLAIKDGQHVYGRASDDADASRAASAANERKSLLDALEGRRVAPGPAGSPHRERRDVLPTGRNMYTADPRMLPTPTAMDLGRMAADEVLRGYMQTHGDMPRALVIDLWGSATLRTGGEEIAQGLALMGCRPVWDLGTGRVTGIEVLPCAAVGRARVDVTWRISGLFRDLFPAQIALLDAATQAIAARDETADENPLAAIRRSANGHAKMALARIFGTAPGAYGAGLEDMIGREADRDDIGAAYLAAASHVYGGANGEPRHQPGAFAERVASADLLLHTGDDPARDLLEGAEDAAFVGGFAAAAASLGRNPDLVMLDTSDPQRPRARSLATALARIVRARAINPRFIAGQMRHGPRGAAELAETVDRLVDFAHTTGAVSSTLLDLVHDAYLADPAVRAFLKAENPAAAKAMAERFEQARRLGLWHPRRNDVEGSIAELRAEAVS